MNKALGKTVVYSLAYLGIAVACVIQWNGTNPRARLDWFAGGYFLLRFAGSLYSIVSSLGAFRSSSLRQEWWGANSDSAQQRWVMLLMALDLMVFLDYGHWRLTPWLAHPALQMADLD